MIQTGKTRKIPIILIGSQFWSGLLQWFENTMVPAGTIEAEDLQLMQIIDEPKAIVEAIFAHYEHRCFGPSAEEHEQMLDL